MSRRMSVLLVASWLAVPGLAVAEDLPPEKIAAIRRDEQAAQARVSAAYGNRKPSELSNEERRQIIQDQQDAGLAVLMLTVVVRGLMWPLHAKAHMTSKRMSLLTPSPQALSSGSTPGFCGAASILRRACCTL